MSRQSALYSSADFCVWLRVQEHALHVQLAGEGEREVLHQIFIVAARNGFLPEMHFTAEHEADGVFHRLTEAVIGACSVLQGDAEPDEPADLLSRIAVLEDTDDDNHRDREPRIFFLDRRIDDLRLDVIVDHALGQSAGTGAGEIAAEMLVHVEQQLVHIEVDARELLPARDMKMLRNLLRIRLFAFFALFCHEVAAFLVEF